MIFLAPQWNEGLIRSELGAVSQAGEAVKNAAQGKLAAGMLTRAVGALALLYFLGNQIINYGTRGHPTWENPEEDFGAKISAWVPDKIGGGPGFFLNPMGLAGEIAHLLQKRYEQSGDMPGAFASLLRTRASAFTRPLWTWWTGRDFLGRPVKRGEMGTTLAKDLIPLPLASPAAFGGAKQLLSGRHAETYTGQFQKQLMASVGLKSDTAPYPEQRLSRLAQDFNESQKIERSPEYNVSDYAELSAALRLENQDLAKQALDDLLKKKMPAEVVAHYLRAFDFPYTGNAQREFQFYQTLNNEQRNAYLRGVINRMTIAQRAIELVSPTAPNAFPVFDAKAAGDKLKARLAVYEAYSLPNGPERQAAFAAIENDPDLVDYAETVEKTLERTAPKTAQKIESLPKKGGAMAKYIFNEWSKLPLGERDAYLESLDKSGVITPDVADQLDELRSASTALQSK